MIKKDIKKNEIIRLNGEDFKYKGTIEREVVMLRNYDNLYECYGRPSDAKTRIYNYWKDFTSVFYWVHREGISGYNCNMFSFNAIVEDKDHQKYYLYITRTNQNIYKVVE